MVFLQSFSSRASRIAATLPSIISDGAITSAPAFTRLYRHFAKSGSVSSFKNLTLTHKATVSVDVYSHRHTSAITRSSGIRFLMWRIARCVTPSSFVNYLFACYAIPPCDFRYAALDGCVEKQNHKCSKQHHQCDGRCPRVIKFPAAST